jgi:hypothetical protein
VHGRGRSLNHAPELKGAVRRGLWNKVRAPQALQQTPEPLVDAAHPSHRKQRRHGSPLPRPEDRSAIFVAGRLPSRTRLRADDRWWRNLYPEAPVRILIRRKWFSTTGAALPEHDQAIAGMTELIAASERYAGCSRSERNPTAHHRGPMSSASSPVPHSYPVHCASTVDGEDLSPSSTNRSTSG